MQNTLRYAGFISGLKYVARFLRVKKFGLVNYK